MVWKKAIEDAVAKTLNNIDRFGDRFPHVSQNGVYRQIENNDWTNGFWSGMLWLCYEYTQDERYRAAASRTVDSFRRRLINHVVLDHHDVGFLYSLSAKAQWIVEKDEEARRLALQAADVLMKRWREPGRYIQAWGPAGDPKEGGRIIIDCLLNLPLLYWARADRQPPIQGSGRDPGGQKQTLPGKRGRQFLPYFLLSSGNGRADRRGDAPGVYERLNLDARPSLGDIRLRVILPVYERAAISGNSQTHGPVFHRASAGRPCCVLGL